LQVLLEADLPSNQAVDRNALDAAKGIVENRVNGLGVTEPVVQIAGERRIVVELPGLTNPEQALALIRQTGLLEFVDAGSNFLPEGSAINTDYVIGSNALTGPTATPTLAATATAGATATPAATANAGATPTAAASPTPAPTPEVPTYHTVMTGAALSTVSVQSNQGRIVVAFTLTPEGKTIFGNHTSANVGRVLAIVLDKKVISSPRIESAITGGEGVIQGSFTTEQANTLALQLRYGSLPVPLKVAETRTIGPTLGQDSLNKSLIAGLIGLSAVIIFMVSYYRLPGAVATLSIGVYALVALAVFKFIPVTLTLAGVAGFMLSTGSALDANILVFERLKEELRAGRSLLAALDLAWRRALSSILDSNIATIIICLILIWFASSFGATIVRGFAVTLLIGVAISLFTALVVTRLLLYTAVSFFKPEEHGKWFGI
jgi:preprotein translocase subunit SecD